MKNLLNLIEEQNQFNDYIEEKVEALRKHQEYLNEYIPKEMQKYELTYTKTEEDKNLHIFSYNELEITIKVENPVDKKIQLSEAVIKRLEIKVLIKRRMTSSGRNYTIYDRTKYKTEYKEKGKYRYSDYESGSTTTESILDILEKIFEEDFKYLASEEDCPFLKG